MGNCTPILSLPENRRLDISVRIDSNSIHTDSGCIAWTGPMDRNGYGKFTAKIKGARRHTGAHRAAWLAKMGDIPRGLQIDHLCMNTSCVNTSHMELVTSKENIRRQVASSKLSSYEGMTRGAKPKEILCDLHGNSEIGIYQRGDGGTYRVCKACKRDYMRTYMRSYKK